jgi:hypothetical protein
MKCETQGCKKKAFSHAYIDSDGQSMYIVFLCKEHLLELWKKSK